MAYTSKLYQQGFEQMMNKLWNLDTDTIKGALVRSTGALAYVYSSVHQVFTDLGGNGIGNSGGSGRANMPALTLTTIEASIFDADDLVFTTVTSGLLAIDGIVLFDDTTINGDLICLIAFTPSINSNGTNITVAWNASGIFRVATA